ncbi:MAG: hypothetical protein ACM31D_11075 [Bacteroidota bacterium]
MGTPKVRTSVDSRVSNTLDRLERLMGDASLAEVEHTTPDSVEEALRRLKGTIPEKQRRSEGD